MALGVELADELIHPPKGLDALAKHLLFDFVEDLVGLVPPVHAVTIIIFGGTSLKVFPESDSSAYYIFCRAV